MHDSAALRHIMTVTAFCSQRFAAVQAGATHLTYAGSEEIAWILGMQ